MTHTYRRLASHVRFRVLGDEGVLLDQRSAEVLLLNPLAAYAVDRLTEGQALEEVISALTEAYPDQDAADITTDVVGFLAELERGGLIEEGG